MQMLLGYVCMVVSFILFAFQFQTHNTPTAILTVGLQIHDFTPGNVRAKDNVTLKRVQTFLIIYLVPKGPGNVSFLPTEGMEESTSRSTFAACWLLL